MNRNNLVLLFAFAITLSANAQQSAFRYKRKLDAIHQEAWYTLTLPPDVFGHADKAFRDLRLFSITGSDTTEVPYVLDVMQTETKRNEVSLPVINTSRKDGILYLGFELASGQKVNYIDLRFKEPNFFGTVKIEGSSDKKEWFEIVANQRIFSIQNSYEKFENPTVNFPVTDYKYLRVSVQSDTPLTFTTASFLNQEIKTGAFENIPSTWRVQNDKKEKKTVIDIRLEHFRPVSHLQVDFATNKDFYRSAEIAFLTDSVQTQKGWFKNYVPVYTGFVTSFNASKFDLGFQFAKDIRVTIFNYDNTPLEIKSVNASGASVQVKASFPSAPTFLFYGNESATAPEYDIAYFKEKIPTSAPAIGLGPEENLTTPEEKANALFENKFWLWGIMIAVIAVLGFFTLRMMGGKNSEQAG
jgi:hypothetical protein